MCHYEWLNEVYWLIGGQVEVKKNLYTKRVQKRRREESENHKEMLREGDELSVLRIGTKLCDRAEIRNIG